MTDEAGSPHPGAPSPGWLSGDGRPSFRARLRRVAITGLVILVPAALTLWVVVKLFAVMDGIFAPVVDRVIGRYLPGVHVPGVGVLLTVLVILALGWLSTNVVGRRLIRWIESVISTIPIAKSVYSSTKGIAEALSKGQKEAFQRVVLIEYPKAGLYALVFVTGSARWPEVAPPLADFLLVFLPTTPNPTSGYLLLVPRENAIELSLTIEEGVRMVISGGILLPELPPREGRLPAPSAPSPAAD